MPSINRGAHTQRKYEYEWLWGYISQTRRFHVYDVLLGVKSPYPLPRNPALEFVQKRECATYVPIFCALRVVYMEETAVGISQQGGGVPLSNTSYI